jgi:hypothetical protein
LKFHTFCTKNLPEKILEDHRKVCNHIGIDVQYHVEDEYHDYNAVYTAHGNFMTSVLQKEKIACFLDIDCLPFDKQVLENAYSWTIDNQSFVGNAQNISHTSMRNHVYAAASCLIISQEAWKNLGSPSLSWFVQDNIQIDTAQILTLRADQIGMHYRLMYPQGWDEGEGFKLAGYGQYGTGTKYPGTWHYFRISNFKNDIPDLWNQRVHDIINNKEIISNYSSVFYGT